VNLHLPAGYRRRRPLVFMDEPTDLVWQPDVYPTAFDLARSLGRSVVVDVGCGYGRKLAPYVNEFTVVGIDTPDVLPHVEVTPITLIAQNLDAEEPLPIDPSVSLVICSDVIEHLWHPERLAMRLAVLGCPVAMSTPDRARTHGRGNLSPLNPCHAQEWTLDELELFLEDCGADISHAGWTRSHDQDSTDATCLVTFGGAL